MILLMPGNRILFETVNAIFKIDNPEKREICDVRLYDFDDISYKIQVTEDDLNTLKVSMTVPCYEEFQEFGGKTALEKYYPDLKTDEAAEGTSLTVRVNLNDVKDKEKLATDLSMLRCYVMGGLFEHYFRAQQKGEVLEKKKVNLINDTTVYFCPSGDRTVVVFAVNFSDNTDKTIAKVFLQEFQDARRTLGSAPPCKWSEESPKELIDNFDIKGDAKNMGYLGFISFAVLKSHVEESRLPQVVKVMQSFRSYLQYHIKCSKTLFHSRMRARIKSLLQVLNRAKLENEDKSKTKKTASGKTWKRN